MLSEGELQQLQMNNISARRYDDYIILKSKIEAEICIDLDRLETMTILDKIAKK